MQGHMLTSGPSLLRTAQLNIQFPMMFKVTNPASGGTTHCGVLEFIAEEGRAYLPSWVRSRTHAQTKALSDHHGYRGDWGWGWRACR
jgi:ubiquitin fusion degradation protein 1